MSSRLEEYGRRLLVGLGTIDLRAIPGLAATRAALELGLADTVVLPRLRPTHGTSKPQALGDVLAQTACALIEGEPGAGKTTLLACLCVAYSEGTGGLRERIAAGRAREPHATPLPKGRVPVLLRLSGFRPADDGPGELDGWMSALLRRDHGELIASDVITAVAAGRGLVCLDGLDEIGDTVLRRRVARAIEKWAARQDGICWVTTRTHGAVALRNFKSFTVVPFSSGDIHEYLVRRELQRSFSPNEAHRRADAWLAPFRDRPAELAVMRNPLLLVIALASEEGGRRLPAERVYLYKGVIDTLVTEWNRERRPDALLRRTGAAVDPRVVLGGLAATALDLHERGMLAGSIHCGELVRMLARHLGTNEAAEDALDVIVDQAGLLVRDGIDGLRFWHASFGEYLAGTALAHAARAQPERLARTAGYGREVVRMAVAYTRCIDGDLPVAQRFLQSLLMEDAGGPWTRLFGATIRVAVDIVLDGHVLDDPGFSRLLSRVLDLLERAPLRENMEALAALATLRPRFEPKSTELKRLLTLLQTDAPPLPEHMRDSMTRWLARTIPDSAEAMSFCAMMLKRTHTRARTWAAMGLLRAGHLSAEACHAVFEFLASGSSGSTEPREAVLIRELDDLNVEVQTTRRAQLHAMMSATPEPSRSFHVHRNGWTDARQHRYVVAAILAALGDDAPEVLAALTEGAASPRSEVGLNGLVRLARTSDRTLHGLVGALLLDASDLQSVAEMVLRTLLDQPDFAGVAAAAVSHALCGLHDPIPDVTTLLQRSQPSFFGSNQRTLRDVLHRLTAGSATALGALTNACKAIEDSRLRWVFAAILWQPAFEQQHDALSDLSAILHEGTTSEDLAVAVTSASLLARAWEHLSPAGRRAVVRVWLRGLQSAGPPLAEDPVDSVCHEAWAMLKHRLPQLDEEERAELHDVLAGECLIPATIAACLLIKEPELRPRCQAMLVAAMSSDNLQMVRVGFRGLDTGQTEPAVREALLVAAIRLCLAGWISAINLPTPATATMLVTFLDESVSAGAAHVDPLDTPRQRMNDLITWLAQHPEAEATAFSRLAATEPAKAERAAWLLAACLREPGQIQALVEASERTSVGVVKGAALALREILRRERATDDSPLQDATRRGLVALLNEHDDLEEVRRTERALGYTSSAVPRVAAMRCRLLHAPKLAWRTEQVQVWLSISCPQEQREAFAQQWFGVGREAVAAALRPCLADDDDFVALDAAWFLAQGFADDAPLRAQCIRILANPADHLPSDKDDRFEWRFRLVTNAAHELFMVLMHAETLAQTRRWALIGLVELEDEAARAAIIEIADSQRLGWWIAKFRPHWLSTFEPWIETLLDRRHDVRHTVKLAREYIGLSPALMTMLAARWARWLRDGPSITPDSFATFIDGPEPLPTEVITAWRADLGSSNDSIRGRAALALAGSGQVSDAIADVLIEMFLAHEPQAARHAWTWLSSPAFAACFTARRLVRAAQWQTPEEAAELALLWSATPDAAEERVLVASLLHAAAMSSDEWTAERAAIDLWALDEPQARALLLERCPRSTRAAVWLGLNGVEAPPVQMRLWSAIEHPAPSDWEDAAVLLHHQTPSDPRLCAILRNIALLDKLGYAIWLLHEHSPKAALAVILDHLARSEPGRWDVLEWLHALIDGRRPGRMPEIIVTGWWSRRALSPMDPEPAPDSSEDSRLDPLRHASTLDILAERLITLASEVPLDLPGAMAHLLGGDPEQWTTLWYRIQKGSNHAADIDAVQSVVDFRPGDRPGQQLARMWWRIQLPAERLMREQDGLLAVTDAGDVPEPALLAQLLTTAFPEEIALRGFLAERGIKNDVPGLGVPPAHLLAEAARVFIARNMHDEVVTHLGDQGVLLATELGRWHARRGPGLP